MFSFDRISKMELPKVVKSCKINKSMLNVVNSIFLVTGFVLLTVGIVVLITYNKYVPLGIDQFFTVPRFMIATAVIIFLTATLGYYLTISPKLHYLLGYIGLLVTILTFEITICALGVQLADDVYYETGLALSQSFQSYNMGWKKTVAWDDLQMQFKCCGQYGKYNYGENGLPVSCCFSPAGVMSYFECTAANAFTQGCTTVLSNWLSYNAVVLYVTAIFITCLQGIITGVVAWMAYKSNQNNNDNEVESFTKAPLLSDENCGTNTYQSI